ncbi:hypothetical protein JCM10908_003251 [Rhodotorula pacifica]|uniref:uncharacterized protein n=1 Tax=Rhodotorula pacifica TaxID=1495444 RepID=UPI00316D9AE9
MSQGGATSTGSKWGMGRKTWRAPSDVERARDAQERFARETERRKIQEIQHAERNIRKERELNAKAARINQQALGFELGARGSPYLGGGIGSVTPRVRSSSFSGYGASPLAGSYPGSPLLSGRVGGLGGASMIGGLPGRSTAHAALQRERLRSQTRALEAEALRREQRARSRSRERAALALANERLLTPRLSPRPGYASAGFPVASPVQGLGRRSSWHGALPAAGTYGLSPQLGYARSPRLAPLGSGVAGLPPLRQAPPLGYRSRSPSAGRVLVSPRIGQPPSPRIVNYNTYNISPRAGDAALGGLGALDDLHLGAAAVDPVVLDEYGQAGGVPAYAQDFVVTDASLAEGRRILRDLGPVEGLSGFEAYVTEDERLNLAISDLTARAQTRGANSVLSVETGEDVEGQIVVRGVAALLS